jgi:hypothetical protein
MPVAYSKSLLIFPINIDSAETVVRHARMLGMRVLGASSIHTQATMVDIDATFYLPHIGAADFCQQLLEALETHSIDLIWTPHHAVWSFLKTLAKSNSQLQGALCGDHPFVQNWTVFGISKEWGSLMQSDVFIETVIPTRPKIRHPLSITAYSSIHRGFLRIPGETDLEKLCVLCSIFRAAPVGDVVEIGSLYGRSAYALGRLASGHRIGTCICIDPWSMTNGADQGAQASLLEHGLPYIDYEHIFAEFLATASEVPGMSYIRLPSMLAIHEYNRCARLGILDAPELSPVPITGSISVLHIDGNHRLDEVRSDIETWVPLVVPGGWVLIDDYQWSFGDGPQVAGDELVRSGLFDLSFCASDTLFLRRAPIAGE